MTVPDLLARIAEYGGRITLEDGQLHLVTPFDPYWRGRIVKDLLPLLKEHRSGLLRHFRGSATDAPEPAPAPPEDAGGRHCRECERTIWLGGPVTGLDVWRTCDRLMCPHFRPEYDPGGWRVQERNHEEWRRRNPR